MAHITSDFSVFVNTTHLHIALPKKYKGKLEKKKKEKENKKKTDCFAK